jgi:hypothetical protein
MHGPKRNYYSVLRHKWISREPRPRNSVLWCSKYHPILQAVKAQEWLHGVPLNYGVMLNRCWGLTCKQGYFKIATEMVKRNVWQERPYLPLYSAFGCSMLLLDMQGHHGTRAIKSEPQHLRPRFHPQSSLCRWGQTLIRTRLKHFADLFPNIHSHIDMVKPLYPVNIT